MAGDKEQLVSMGFDPARVDCELTLPCKGRQADNTRVIEGDAQFRFTGQLSPFLGHEHQLTAKGSYGSSPS